MEQERLTGWTAFAGVVMLVIGILDAIYGLAALLNDTVVTVGGGSGVLIWDFTTWGREAGDGWWWTCSGQPSAAC